MLIDRYAFFSPTKESKDGPESFLVESPHKLVEDGKVSNKVPWLTGVNSSEGLIYLIGTLKYTLYCFMLCKKNIVLFMNPFATIRLNSEWNVLAPRLLGFDELDDPHKRRIAQKARSYYLQNRDFSEEDFQDILQLFSDSNFNYGFRTSAIAHSKQQPVYAYYYNYNGTFGFFQSFQGMSRAVPKVLDWFWSMAYTWLHSEVSGKDFVHRGPCHGDELALLWRIPLIAHITSDNPDYSLSRAMVKMLVDFATNEY
jgi:carboxylesterase type B